MERGGGDGWGLKLAVRMRDSGQSTSGSRLPDAK